MFIRSTSVGSMLYFTELSFQCFVFTFFDTLAFFISRYLKYGNTKKPSWFNEQIQGFQSTPALQFRSFISCGCFNSRRDEEAVVSGNLHKTTDQQVTKTGHMPFSLRILFSLVFQKTPDSGSSFFACMPLNMTSAIYSIGNSHSFTIYTYEYNI